jgi:sugar phosphate isomerase/epimerase
LATEQETELRIHPFMIMDVTLNIYLKKNTAEAFEISKRIIDSCRRVGGELIVIWHNNSLCEQKQWQGWTEFYRDLLSYASNK